VNDTTTIEEEEATRCSQRRDGGGGLSPMSRRVPLGQVLDIIEESNKEGGIPVNEDTQSLPKRHEDSNKLMTAEKGSEADQTPKTSTFKNVASAHNIIGA